VSSPAYSLHRTGTPPAFGTRLRMVIRPLAFAMLAD